MRELTPKKTRGPIPDIPATATAPKSSEAIGNAQDVEIYTGRVQFALRKCPMFNNAFVYNMSPFPL